MSKAEKMRGRLASIQKDRENFEKQKRELEADMSIGRNNMSKIKKGLKNNTIIDEPIVIDPSIGSPTPTTHHSGAAGGGSGSGGGAHGSHGGHSSSHHTYHGGAHGASSHSMHSSSNSGGGSGSNGNASHQHIGKTSEHHASKSSYSIHNTMVAGANSGGGGGGDFSPNPNKAPTRNSSNSNLASMALHLPLDNTSAGGGSGGGGSTPTPPTPFGNAGPNSFNLSLHQQSIMPSGPRISEWCYQAPFDSTPPVVKNKELYETVRLLGRGSFGEVLLVKNCEDNKLFAIKSQLCPKDADYHLVLREVKFLRSNRHPCIIDVHDAFATHNPRIVYIVMHYCESGTIASVIAGARKNKSTLAENQIIKWTLQLALGLQFLHDNGTIHRDLKPMNIMLTEGGDTLKLADFGLAKSMAESSEPTAMEEAGTPYYTAPEMIQMIPYSFPADCWSFGVIVHQLLALERPFEGSNTADLVKAILTGSLAPLPAHYSDDIKLVSRELLQKDQGDRLTMTELLLEPIFYSKLTQFPGNYRPRTLEERIRRAHIKQLDQQIEVLGRLRRGELSMQPHHHSSNSNAINKSGSDASTSASASASITTTTKSGYTFLAERVQRREELKQVDESTTANTNMTTVEAEEAAEGKASSGSASVETSTIPAADTAGTATAIEVTATKGEEEASAEASSTSKLPLEVEDAQGGQGTAVPQPAITTAVSAAVVVDSQEEESVKSDLQLPSGGRIGQEIAEAIKNDQLYSPEEPNAAAVNTSAEDANTGKNPPTGEGENTVPVEISTLTTTSSNIDNGLNSGDSGENKHVDNDSSDMVLSSSSAVAGAAQEDSGTKESTSLNPSSNDGGSMNMNSNSSNDGGVIASQDIIQSQA